MPPSLSPAEVQAWLPASRPASLPALAPSYAPKESVSTGASWLAIGSFGGVWGDLSFGRRRGSLASLPEELDDDGDELGERPMA